jgi:hypothetical protein
MKKIAAILLFIFTLVQTGPAIHSLCADTITVFMPEEEKGNEKADDTEKKDKKDFTLLLTHSQTLSHKINTAFHLAEKIEPYPCLEKLTPPPNFC